MISEETPELLSKDKGKDKDPYSRKKNIKKMKSGEYSEQNKKILDESFEIASLLK